MVTGTDEATYGGGSNGRDANFVNADMRQGDGKIDPSTSRADVLWNNAFPNINTASGIIENGEEANMNPAWIAEAYFFRAFSYFNLVQTFGGVPLDLGSGELKFNSTPNAFSVRNTVPEVYTKCIFPDLIKAVADLPATGRFVEDDKHGAGSTATKTLARLFLAKAYLTYGWWLENPNNIPTYPDCDRTDPDGQNSAWYFQQAYNIAVEAISDSGPFALQPTFRDVNVATNDRNNEILMYTDHTESSELFNGASLSYSNGDTRDNVAVWALTWYYEQIHSAKAPVAGTDPSTPIVGDASSVQRETAQWGGRPWIRMSIPIGVFTNTFADKTNDSRYDGTFTTVLRGNWDKSSALADVTEMYNANNMPVHPGEPILSFLLDESIASTITYPVKTVGDDMRDPLGKGVSNVGAGWLPGRADWIIGTSRISRILYPQLWKLGVYRTDNASGYGQVNAASTRPFSIAKFSELFFIAAEAAVKGASTQTVSGTYANDGTARGLINIIRARAGKWKFSNALNQTVTGDNSAAMVDATPATIDIDYILAERSREYFGEGYRWYDLVRTQTWARIAATYSICESPQTNTTDHKLVTYTRTPIDAHLYLRPIPSSQISALMMDNEAKAAYQNPGY